MVKCFSQKRNKYRDFPDHVAKDTKALNEAGWVAVVAPLEQTIAKKPKVPLTKTTI